jgi:ABC-type multidrug transport system fused ATPase/permease subunit
MVQSRKQGLKPDDPVQQGRESRLEPLLNLLRGNSRLVGLLAVASVLSGLAEAGILAIVAQVAATLATGENRLKAQVGPVHIHSSVTTLLGVGAALAFARLVLQAPISYIPARLGGDVEARLRTRLFSAFSRASWAEQSKDRDGHFQELMTGQVIHATQAAMQAALLVTALLAFSTLVASALALDAQAAAIVVGVSLVLFAALRPLTVLGIRHARALSKAELAHASAVSESNQLAEETQVFGVAAAQRERVGMLIEQARASVFRMQLVSRLAANMYQSLIYVLLVVGLALVYTFANGGVAALGGVFLLLVRAGAYGNQIQTYYQSVRQALPFVERLQSAEKRYGESAPTRGKRRLATIRTLAFDDVSFAYNADRHALAHVSFEIRSGDVIGIVGPSGAGKSTLAQLVLQLRIPTRGQYLVNGEEAALFSPDDWHRRFAYVPQSPHLIHASAAENIAYFRNIPQHEVERAARLARIEDDILSWRDGYDARVGPRADAVSGGQAQRICLARSLAGRPQVLLLDEPTSALDPTSERLIQESLKVLKGTTTLVIIAHRMSTLDLCDRVMVLVDGRIDAFETLDVLNAENLFYRSVGARDPEAHIRKGAV